VEALAHESGRDEPLRALHQELDAEFEARLLDLVEHDALPRLHADHRADRRVDLLLEDPAHARGVGAECDADLQAHEEIALRGVPVHDRLARDARVGDEDRVVLGRLQARGPHADRRDAPAQAVLEVDPLTDADRLVEQDLDAREDVLQDVLQREPDREAADAERGRERQDRHVEDLQHGDDDDGDEDDLQPETERRDEALELGVTVHPRDRHADQQAPRLPAHDDHRDGELHPPLVGPPRLLQEELRDDVDRGQQEPGPDDRREPGDDGVVELGRRALRGPAQRPQQHELEQEAQRDERDQRRRRRQERRHRKFQAEDRGRVRFHGGAARATDVPAAEEEIFRPTARRDGALAAGRRGRICNRPRPRRAPHERSRREFPARR